MKKISLLIGLFLMLAVQQTFAQQEDGVQYSSEERIEKASVILPPSDEILGLWWSPQKDAKIEIYKEEGKFFGRIVWLQNPLLRDERNEDPELNGRPIMGINLLKGFEYNSRKKEWTEGMVYEPYKGKFYGSFLRLDKKNINKLLVRGFLMSARFLGRTEIFTRVN